MNGVCDAIISTSFVILILSIIFFIFHRQKNMKTETVQCDECVPCETLCAQPSRQKVTTSPIDRFDRLQGMCATKSGPMFSEEKVKIKTVRECAGLCDSIDHCMGFNFKKSTCSLITALDSRNKLNTPMGSDRSAGNCYRKRLPSKQFQSSDFSFVGNGECVNLDANGDKFEPLATSVEAASLDECARQCRDSEKCSSFSFNSLLKKCLLGEGQHETVGKDLVNDSTSCHLKKFARPSIMGYSSEPGECISNDANTTRVRSIGRRDADTEEKCAKLCNNLEKCIGFTFDKRIDRGCQIINGSDNPLAKKFGVKGSRLQREAFSCYLKEKAKPGEREKDLDRMTRILRSKEFSVIEDNAKGKLILIDDGMLQHVASTYCENEDICISNEDPSQGCMQYSDGKKFFSKATHDQIDENKLCFRKQHQDFKQEVFKGREAFRRGLDIDRVDANPVLNGQSYIRKPGKLDGDVDSHHDDFEEAVKACNASVACTGMSIISPNDIYNFKNATVKAVRGEYRGHRIKRNGFMEIKNGIFPCDPSRQFDSAMEAERFCRDDAICRGFDGENRTFSCDFESEPMVLVKKS